MKLTAVAVEHRVGCIAEEMNEEGLADAKQSKSVPQIVAGSLGLPHIFCEASRKKRADLGVREEAEIRCWGNLYEKSDAEIDAQVKESFRRREAYWLERVEALGTWPVLFICGAKRDRNIRAYEDDGDKWNKPHRIILTVPTNIAVGTEGSDMMSNMTTWYEKKDRNTYTDVAWGMDAKLLEEYMIAVGY